MDQEKLSLQKHLEIISYELPRRHPELDIHDAGEVATILVTPGETMISESTMLFIIPFSILSFLLGYGISDAKWQRKLNDIRFVWAAHDLMVGEKKP